MTLPLGDRVRLAGMLLAAKEAPRSSRPVSTTDERAEGGSSDQRHDDSVAPFGLHR